MKIAILTHPLGVNYGGILQAYALSTYLEKEGHKVVLLNRQHDMSFLKRIIKLILIAIHYPRYYNPKYKKLKNFVKQNINYTKPIYSSAELANYLTNNNINWIIVGSDQVWRADFALGYGFNYFLSFVPSYIKKMSYAASFGLSEWKYTEEQTSKIKYLINKFDAISVREDEGVTLCKQNLHINTEQVLDPTMLLQAEEYASITSKRLVNMDYAFVYWLGSEEEKKKVLSSVIGKKIIDISLKSSASLISIEDWLSYIKYADIVITDSYHGCVFSILFQKQFYICANKSGGNGRLKSLFATLDIGNMNDGINQPVDYSKIATVLESQRKKSFEFIRSAIK